MKLKLLADHPQAVPVLAKWYYEEWGHKTENNSLEREITRVKTYLNDDRIPLIVIAVDNGEVIGGAQLKYYEMYIYPEKEHWLGGVYVRRNYRGRGIAEKMIREVIKIAGQYSVEKLYLQTNRLDGGLYRRLGWQPVEEVTYQGEEVLVMVRMLDR